MRKTISIQHRWNRYIILCVVMVTILSAMAFSLYNSDRMINKYVPLVDATMLIKFEATTAHLWFEEIISGDRNEKFEDITNHIDQAIWYANVMIEGGENPEGTFIPLSDKALKKEVKSTIELLMEFQEITTQRYNAFEAAGVGTEIDQKYDKLFKIFIGQIDNVKKLLQGKIKESFRRYHSIQIALIITVLMLTYFLILTLNNYDREHKEDLIKISEAKEKAEKSENWLKTTMNSMGDGVIITDHNGIVTFLNPVASSLTGWHVNDAKNKKMTDVFNIVNEQTKKPLEDIVNTVIRKNVVVGLANHTELIAKDGTVWPIADSAAPIFDHDNNLLGVVVVFHEITAQKKAEAEKEILEAQLRQAFKMEAIGTLAGGIAHDFNNILAIIIGNADMAQDDIPSTNPAQHNIDQVLEAATRAKKLVRQILSFSRQGEDKKEPYYLCRLIEENMKSLRSTIPTSVELKIEIPSKCHEKTSDCLMVLVDPTQIHQLLLNLCVNAVQAMDEKGTLNIKVDEVTFRDNVPNDRPGMKPGTYEYLSVADSGTGMSPDIINKIFDPFFTTKDVDKGTGMGLSVVHGIVEGHGGHIYAESERGKGSIFHIYFPITDVAQVEKIKKDSPLPVGVERILLVDDEPMLASVGKEMLERLGYSVATKTDSLEALELYKKDPEQFDLVITDQTMPNMTGIEFAAQLLKMKPTLPIILCTGYSSKVDKIKAKQTGISDFASKPLKRRDLAILIRKVLDENRDWFT